MEPLFAHLSEHDGVALATAARDLGVSWEREQVLVERAVLDRPAPGVVRATSAPLSWRQSVRVASLAPGSAVISHGAAARLHRLDGFERYEAVDVLCRKGWWPNCPDGTITHFTRGLTEPSDVVLVDEIPTLSVAATLTLLAPVAGLGATAKALDSALRDGTPIDELREVGRRWRKRGRSGPGTLLMLLDEREGKTLPRSWFQRIAGRMLERHGVRMVDEYDVRTSTGRLVASLDLANPHLKIGVECQSWRWHATPEAQHRDARRKGVLRQMGWEIVDVWWRDLGRPEPVIAELAHLVKCRRANLSA